MAMHLYPFGCMLITAQANSKHGVREALNYKQSGEITGEVRVVLTGAQRVNQTTTAVDHISVLRPFRLV